MLLYLRLVCLYKACTHVHKANTIFRQIIIKMWAWRIERATTYQKQQHKNRNNMDMRIDLENGFPSITIRNSTEINGFVYMYEY